MTFSKDYGKVLSPFAQKYKMAKNEKGRKEILKNAVDAVEKSRELLEDKGSDLPKDLKTVCLFFWIHLLPISFFVHFNQPMPSL
jgi:hypothetical protein